MSENFVPLALVRSEGTLPTPEEDIPLLAEWLALKDLHPEQWAATTGALQHKIEAKRQAKRERRGRGDEAEPRDDHGPAEILYFHTDHLGTPRELTDGGGRIVWSATYKAWGNANIEHPAHPVRRVVGNTQFEAWEATSEPVQQNLRFQGQYFDGETGLHYNRFRYYDPDIGRFVSQDPIGLAGGINNYQYAPNPVGWIDPLGLNKINECKCDLVGENWKFDPEKDIDLRGTGKKYKDGLDEAFKKTGVSRSDFEVVKWGKDEYGKTIPVEWSGPGGANVNMDIPAWNNKKTNGSMGEGPHAPHIGYQTPGKPRTRGHVFLDHIPATRR
ncbi:RHS repeat-associated core domain-containing protein [Pseudomonas mangiferae]|uniref:RHS repeat-associated core domain-containing protein n=1 Tax=Pseudomonas mangiferae TaxID=2593654 RepID=UPI001E38698A|nr:polymorphic toxin type 47 domain-containing protein [Pseudomonas mangiferae]